MTKLLCIVISCVLVLLQTAAGVAIDEAQDAAQIAPATSAASSLDAQITAAAPVAKVDTITVAASQTSSITPSSTDLTTATVTAAAAAFPSDYFSGTILIDTSSRTPPQATSTASSPQISAVSATNTNSQSSNLLKIIIPIIGVIALIIITWVFVYLIRLKYKYRGDPIDQEANYAREWPQARGGDDDSFQPSFQARDEKGAERETMARFSFISRYSETSRFSRFPGEQPYYTSDKPLPIAPTFDMDEKRAELPSPYMAFSPQELEGSQVDLSRYSQIDEKRASSFI